MKAVKTAALVVGAVALVATGVGAAASVGMLGAAAAHGAVAFGLSAGALTTIGAVAGAVAGLANMAASMMAKPPAVTVSGNQTKFTASQDMGIPYAIGRTAVAGWMVHRQTFDANGSKNNAFQTMFGVWSSGRIKAIEAFQVDGKPVAFSGDQATGGFQDFMWLRTQLGAEVEPDALQATSFAPYPAGWSADSKLSGYAAFAWTLKFDDQGKIYPGGSVPAPRAVVLGNHVYDPRLDDTYPGGSGPCRALDESTYVYSENGALHALTWALGRWQQGKRLLGIGFALSSIDVGSFVQAANVAEANGWRAGGVVYSTDGKWDALKKMLGSCSAEPLKLGGMLGCTVDTPRVSLATVTDDDIIGRCSIPGTSRIRDRINGVIPSYRSEAHDWQIVPAAKVQIADYVAADRRPRTKAITWELVQDAAQVAQLAAYHICNSREFGPAVLPLKLRWIGYRPGDAITIQSNTVGMRDQLVVIRTRHLDPATGAVTLTVRSETSEKHAFALGKTTTPPPTPALQAIDRTELLSPGISASWSAVANDDGNRPEDRADVTRTAWQRLAGRTVEQAVQDIDTNADAVLKSALLVADYKRLNDELAYLDGKSVGTVFRDWRSEQQTLNSAYAAKFDLIGATTTDGRGFVLNSDSVQIAPGKGLTTAVTSLQQSYQDQQGSIDTINQVLVTPDGATVKGIIRLNSNGHIVGSTFTNDGRQGGITFVVDTFQIAEASPRARGRTVFSIADGVVYMDEVVVQRLRINTAVAPVRVAQSAAVQGQYGGDTGVAAPRQSIGLDASIYLREPGWIEVNAVIKQSFTGGLTSRPWSAAIAVNGLELGESVVGGSAAQDVLMLQGAAYMPAGTHKVECLWAAHSSVQAGNRSLFAKGFPNTDG